MNKIEILAPAGNMETAKAAINSEANAIYVGGKNFGARSYANNLSNDELREIIEYAHLRSKKVYVTVNTVIFDNEIDDVVSFLDFIYLNKVDAVIIQDLGLADIIRTRYSDLAMHASTQMNITTLEEAIILKELGFKRIILAREVNIQEIKKIKEQVDIELEVFVHGALCMSYSGNCYLSSFSGGRSGNRGRCAQPCRLLYKFNDQNKYYLSTKDLCTLDNLDEILASGVSSLKIEGRMKRPMYVRQVVKSYYNKIYNKVDVKNEIHDLKLVFNREFTKGFILGEENKNFSNVNSSNHIGLYIGNVISSYNENITIKLTHRLVYGDSIRIVNQDTHKEDAITINQMNLKNKLVKEACSGDVISVFSHLRGLNGSFVYLTTSKKQLDELSKYNEIKSLIDLNAYVSNEYLYLEAKYNNISVNNHSKVKVEFTNKDFTSRLIEQLIKTNDTPFKVNDIKASFSRYYLPIKEINELRRTVLKHLENEIIESFYTNRIINNCMPIKNEIVKTKTKLFAVIIENEEQLNIVKNYNVDIYVANYNLYLKYKDLINGLFYYESRVKKYTNNVSESMTSKLAHDKHGSMYMNVTNIYTINLLQSLKYKSISLSIELNNNLIICLLEKYALEFGQIPNINLMVYGYYELMIMKHCFINKELNKEHLNCGGCNNKYLIDQKDAVYPIDKDEYCNLKLLNNSPLHLYSFLNDLKARGINRFILAFTIENAETVKNIMEIYIKNKEIELSDFTFGHFQGTGVL